MDNLTLQFCQFTKHTYSLHRKGDIRMCYIKLMEHKNLIGLVFLYPT